MIGKTAILSVTGSIVGVVDDPQAAKSNAASKIINKLRVCFMFEFSPEQYLNRQESNTCAARKCGESAKILFCIPLRPSRALRLYFL
jgi:hypothetical protein